MRLDRDLLLGVVLLSIAAATGTGAVQAAQRVTRPVEMDAPLLTSGQTLLHLLIGLGSAAWIVGRVARRVHLRTTVASVIRSVAWILAFGLTIHALGGHGVQTDAQRIASAWVALVIPLVPLLFGALFYDLGLLLVYRGRAKPPGGFDPPSGAVFAGLYAGLLPVAFVGLLAFLESSREFHGPPLFEALAGDAGWTIPLVALATPVALVKLVVAAIAPPHVQPPPRVSE